VSISQLGKYIPGGIWHFIARYASYKENNLSIKDIGKAFIIENYWVVISSIFFSLFFIVQSDPINILEKLRILFLPKFKFILLFVILIVWYVLLIFIEVFLNSSLTKKMMWQNLRRFLSQFIMWVVYGLSFLILLLNHNFSQLSIYIIGAIVLSFVAGYLVIFAPGGLGFREFAAVFLFSTIFSATEISAYLLVHRFLYTVVEFFMGLYSYVFIEKKMKKPLFIKD